MTMSTKKQNIGILTFPIGKAGIIPTSNLVDIICSISNNIYLFIGDEGYASFKEDKRIHTYEIRHKKGTNVIMRIIRYICTQVKSSYMLARLGKSVDLWIFFIGGDTLVFPMITAKLLRENVVLAFAGSSILTEKFNADIFSKVLEFLSNINCTLSDKIIVYSTNIIREWHLEKYRKKICVAHEHFLDLGVLKIKKKLDERKNVIGYVGRVSGEKGVSNFVKSIPEISKKREDLKFLVLGYGPLCNEIKRYLDENDLNDRVKLTGWIPHENLPDYLNELKMAVLPSYTEGLPNLMLEAMACGTPVLATPVGAIPDVIKDGKTGFVMENNSPECISRNVIRALEYQELDTIVKNAKALVETEYTYNATLEIYRGALEELL